MRPKQERTGFKAEEVSGYVSEVSNKRKIERKARAW
jgi:hypothetical protein